MSVYFKWFDETKYMCFLIEDEELLQAYNKTWKKISNIMPKGFDSETV